MATHQEDVLTRLRLCNLDITGVTLATEHPTSELVDSGALPYVYVMMGADRANPITQGIADVTVDFVGYVLCTRRESSSETTTGLYALSLVSPYKDRFRRYFSVQHPLLSTSTLAPLGFLQLPVRYSSTQVSLIDGDYWGFSYTLSITWREAR